MSCPYCDSNDYSTNGTAGWYCEECNNFFNVHWWASEHEEEICNAEDFILNIGE